MAVGKELVEAARECVHARRHAPATAALRKAVDDLYATYTGTWRPRWDDDTFACCAFLEKRRDRPDGDGSVVFQRKVNRHQDTPLHIAARHDVSRSALARADRDLLRLGHATNADSDRFMDDRADDDIDEVDYVRALYFDGVPALRVRLYRLAGLRQDEARRTEAAGLTVDHAVGLVTLAGLRGNTREILTPLADFDADYRKKRRRPRAAA